MQAASKKVSEYAFIASSVECSKAPDVRAVARNARNWLKPAMESGMMRLAPADVSGVTRLAESGGAD